jgi:hypothetical protein
VRFAAPFGSVPKQWQHECLIVRHGHLSGPYPLTS